MINEEISNKTLHLTVQATKTTAKEIYKLLSELIKKLDQGNKSLGTYLKETSKEVEMKEMVKKGQLEELEVKKGDLKELKKELNKYGVKFSVMKDKSSENYSVFFQAKDTAVMEKAFRNTLVTVEKKEAKKDSVVEAIDKFKQTIKDTVTKDKVKNKQKEQSL